MHARTPGINATPGSCAHLLGSKECWSPLTCAANSSFPSLLQCPVHNSRSFGSCAERLGYAGGVTIEQRRRASLAVLPIAPVSKELC